MLIQTRGKRVKRLINSGYQVLGVTHTDYGTDVVLEGEKMSREDEFIDSIDNFAHFLDGIQSLHETLVEELSKADGEDEDFLHEIELTRFNAYEGYVLANNLKDSRIRRREVKDFMEVVQSFKSVFYDNNKGLALTLFKVLTRLKSLREGQNNKIYIPRVRTDIKLAKNIIGEVV